MKKILILISCILINTHSVFAQTPCTGTLFPPCTTPWQNTDLWQIDRDIRLSALGGSFSIAGNVGGFTDKIIDSLFVDGLYAAGDNIGGIRTMTNTMRVGQRTVILEDVCVFDALAQNAAITLDFYSGSPNGTFTNNSPTVISDYYRYIGSVSISSSDYITQGTVSRGAIKSIGMVLKTYEADSRNIYYTITTSATPQYVNNKLVFKFGVLQD